MRHDLCSQSSFCVCSHLIEKYIRERDREKELSTWLIEVADPLIDFIQVVGEVLIVWLGFQNEFAFVNNEESKWPWSICLVKGVVHVIDKHRHLKVEVVVKLLGIVESLWECCRLIDRWNGFSDRPLITSMCFGDVDSQEADAVGRMGANKRAKDTTREFVLTRKNKKI